MLHVQSLWQNITIVLICMEKIQRLIMPYILESSLRLPSPMPRDAFSSRLCDSSVIFVFWGKRNVVAVEWLYLMESCFLGIGLRNRICGPNLRQRDSATATKKVTLDVILNIFLPLPRHFMYISLSFYEFILY